MPAFRNNQPQKIHFNTQTCSSGPSVVQWHCKFTLRFTHLQHFRFIFTFGPSLQMHTSIPAQVTSVCSKKVDFVTWYDRTLKLDSSAPQSAVHCAHILHCVHHKKIWINRTVSDWQRINDKPETITQDVEYCMPPPSKVKVKVEHLL